MKANPDPERSESLKVIRKKRTNFDTFQSVIEGREHVENRPLQLFLEITSRCNLRCAKCGLNYDPARQTSQNLSTDFLSELSSLYESAIEVETFGYGEMFLHPELRPLVELLKRCGCRVAGVTNGTRIGPEETRWLVAAGYDELTFSIDGATQETMHRLRGADLSQIFGVLAALKQEKEAQRADRPRVVVNFVAQKDNFHELPELARILGGLGVFFLGVNPLHHFSGPIDAYGKLYDEFRLANVERHAFEAAVRKAEQIARANGIEFASHVDLDFEWRTESARPASRVPAEPSEPRGPSSSEVTPSSTLPRNYCVYPWTTLYVAANRSTKVCCYMSAEENLGTVRSGEDVLQVWSGKRLGEIRAAISEGRVHRACRVCVEHRTYAGSRSTLAVLERQLVESEATSGVDAPPYDVEGGEPEFEGFHDVASPEVVVGWAWDRKRPSRPLLVDIFDGGRLLSRVTANEPRNDLLSAGKGDGSHGFTYRVPARLRDGKKHVIRVQVAGSRFPLEATPKSFRTGSARKSRFSFFNRSRDA